MVIFALVLFSPWWKPYYSQKENPTQPQDVLCEAEQFRMSNNPLQ